MYREGLLMGVYKAAPEFRILGFRIWRLSVFGF